jgi:hypothetical protein
LRADKEEIPPEEFPAEEIPPSSPAAPFGPNEEAAAGPPAAKPVSRSQVFLRRALRWGAGLLIVFALGALAVTWFLYRPQAQELAETRAALQQAEARAAELEAEINRLKPLDRTNETLQAELDQADLHIRLLATLAQVNRARLALADEDIAEARAGLDGTAQELTELAKQVGPGEREQVTAMQSRLELVRGEIEQDAFAAQSDLRVIAANLEQLQAALFEEP